MKRRFRFVYRLEGELFDRECFVESDYVLTARELFKAVNPKADRVTYETVHDAAWVIHEALTPNDSRAFTWQGIVKAIENRNYERLSIRMENMRMDGDYREAFECIARTISRIHP